MKLPFKATFFAFAACISAEAIPASSLLGVDSVQEHEIIGLGTVRIGQELTHAKFGVGKVEEIQPGEEGITVINITFPSVGSKWLIAEHTNLKQTTE